MNMLVGSAGLRLPSQPTSGGAPAFVPGKKRWSSTACVQFSTVRLSDVPQDASLEDIFHIFVVSPINCFTLSCFILIILPSCLNNDTFESLKISKNRQSKSRLFFVLVITLCFCLEASST